MILPENREAEAAPALPIEEGQGATPEPTKERMVRVWDPETKTYKHMTATAARQERNPGRVAVPNVRTSVRHLKRQFHDFRRRGLLTEV